MSYLREIPRDLFNEASLLKCFGQLYLRLEAMGLEGQLSYHSGNFEIEQNVDGMTTIGNVRIVVRNKVREIWRPLNSREQFPLYLYPDGYEGDAEAIEIFDEAGRFTAAMLVFLCAK